MPVPGLSLEVIILLFRITIGAHGLLATVVRNSAWLALLSVSQAKILVLCP